MRNNGYIDERGVVRRSVAPTGIILVLLGIWAGLIPFVGPYFNYQMQTTDAWHWTNDHLWFSVLPGAAIFVGGWLIARGVTRSGAGLGGLLAFCGGLWLVIGPTFAALWKDGAIGGGPAFGGTGVRVAEWLGFYYGAGALAILLAGYALGHLASVGLFVRRGVPATATTTAGAAPATSATRPVAREPVAATGDDPEVAAAGDPKVDEATGAGAPRRGRFLRRPLVRSGR